MSSDNLLEKVKRLREITGVGFKDCKNAIDENNGDIDKSIEFLRKKGIAKANKKMERIAADGLVCIQENKNTFSMIEINSETDFVAKNDEFIAFVQEVSKISISKSKEKRKYNPPIHCDADLHKIKLVSICLILSKIVNPVDVNPEIASK